MNKQETPATTAHSTEYERYFGANVRAQRRARGWSQEELARRLAAYGHKLHAVTIGKLETAARPTSVGEMGALAAIFEVEVEDLLRRPQNPDKQARVEEALVALNAVKVELKSVNEEISALQQRAKQLKRKKDVAWRHWKQVSKSATGHVPEPGSEQPDAAQ